MAWAGGFFGSLGKAAQDAAERHRANDQKMKDGQAKIYWDAIQSPDTPIETKQYAQGQLQKLYGGSKGVKELFEKFGQAVGVAHKHLDGTAGGGQGTNGQQGQPPATTGQQPNPPAQMTPPPPQATPTAAAGAANVTQGAGAVGQPPAKMTPPPAQPQALSTVASQTYDPSKVEDRKFANWKRQEDLIHKYGMEEDSAKQKAIAEAKAASPSGRPVVGPSTSVRDARTMALQGKTFFDKDGTPIDLTALPDEMGLKFIAWGGKYFYEPFSPNQSTITVGNETYAISPMDKAKLTQGAGVNLGQHNMPSTSASTDPATGQTTVTKRTPATTGATGGPPIGATAMPATAPAQMTTPPAAMGATAKSRTGAGAAKPSASAGTPPALDENGHVPSNYVGSTPQIVEGANQLLDGTDKDKLPSKTRELSAALARRYGWEQGKFTPKEQVMLREASTFLTSALDDKSLSVLDRGFTDRMQLAQVLANPDKEGLIGRGLSTASAMNLDDDQAAFVRMYNQLVGTISGLGQLVRSGRATEATISRLKTELPNPVTTASSDDARNRIRRLQKELDVGLAKGSFTGDTKAPAKSSGGGGVVHWKRDASGNPVPDAAPANP